MKVEKPILHPKAKQAIADLRSKGVPVCDEDVLWLQHLASASRDGNVIATDQPVFVGGAALWPLTIGAGLWLRQKAGPWMQGLHGEWNLKAIAYAMAHRKNLPGNRPETILRIAAWMYQLDCSMRELDQAVQRVLRIEDREYIEAGPARKVKDDSDAYDGVLAMLLHHYEETPSYWLWEVSEDTCCALLDKLPDVCGWAGNQDPVWLRHCAFQSAIMHIRAAASITHAKPPIHG